MADHRFCGAHRNATRAVLETMFESARLDALVQTSGSAVVIEVFDIGVPNPRVLKCHGYGVRRLFSAFFQLNAVVRFTGGRIASNLTVNMGPSSLCVLHVL